MAGPRMSSECEGKHALTKIFAKASRSAASKTSAAILGTGRRSRSSGAGYGLRVHEGAQINTHQHVRGSAWLGVLRVYLPPPASARSNTDAPQGAGFISVHSPAMRAHVQSSGAFPGTLNQTPGRQGVTGF